MRQYQDGNSGKMDRVLLGIVIILWGIVLTAGCLQVGDSGGNEGILQGKVSIGPICPVERPGVTCEPPPEAYAARKVVVYGEDGTTLVKVVAIDATGQYRTSLPPGTYVVDINRAGIDRSGDVPKTVMIRAGETVTLDIDIDTGIR